MGEVGGIVCNRIDVEKYCAWNVRGNIFRLGVALLRRKVVRAVNDDDVFISELGGEPFGRLEPAACGFCCSWLRPIGDVNAHHCLIVP